jgi:hypothetical protein
MQPHEAKSTQGGCPKDIAAEMAEFQTVKQLGNNARVSPVAVRPMWVIEIST